MRSILSVLVGCMIGLPLAGSASAARIPVSSVTASSTWFTYDVNNLINGVGLVGGGLHSGLFTGKWMTNATPTGTLTFDLGAVYDLTSSEIWNYGPGCCGDERSTKDLGIEISLDGGTFTSLTSIQLAQPVGDPFAGEAVGLVGATARFVRFNLNSTYGPSSYIGLSEVQFFGDAASVPEPGTIALLALGLAGLAAPRRRRQ